MTQHTENDILFDDATMIEAALGSSVVSSVKTDCDCAN